MGVRQGCVSDPLLSTIAILLCQCKVFSERSCSMYQFDFYICTRQFHKYFAEGLDNFLNA